MSLIFTNISTFSPSFSGTIDGQGYDWWWYSISCALPNANHSDTRADMLTIVQSENILIEGITFLNSPKYHVNLKDCHNVTVRDFVIEVDVFRQKKMLNDAGFIDSKGIPTFPLNTDGIDPSASDVHIYNGSITNFDDAVAFKPCRVGNAKCRSCASGLVEDLKVTYSVGMTIGSVPPNGDINCVKDVIFRNIQMDKPLKGWATFSFHYSVLVYIDVVVNIRYCMKLECYVDANLFYTLPTIFRLSDGKYVHLITILFLL